MIELNNLNIILTGATGVIGSSILEKLYKAKANIIFRVKGTNKRKPIKSGKKPGIINNTAAIAIDAPDIIS